MNSSRVTETPFSGLLLTKVDPAQDGSISTSVEMISSGGHHYLSCICHTSVTNYINSSVFSASQKAQETIFGGSCQGKHSETHLAVCWCTHTLFSALSDQPILSRLPSFVSLPLSQCLCGMRKVFLKASIEWETLFWCFFPGIISIVQQERVKICFLIRSHWKAY